jgi:hypothetical protein
MSIESTAMVRPPRSRSRERSDSKPWYRQFWPWFLIGLPAISVVFSFATLYIAVRDADEVVPHEGDSSSYSAPRAPAPKPVATVKVSNPSALPDANATGVAKEPKAP